MGKLYWKGGSGANDDAYANPATAANWQTATGGAGSVPEAGDVAIFDGRADKVPDDYSEAGHTVGKHYNCYGNSITAAQVIVLGGYTGKVGMSDAETDAEDPVDITVTDNIDYQGEQACLLNIPNTVTIPQVRHKSSSGSLTLSVTGTGKITQVLCLDGGTLELEDSCDCLAIISTGSTVITAHYGCTAFNLTANGGQVYTDSSLGTVINYGATIVAGNSDYDPTNALTTSGEQAIGSLIQSSGAFTWRYPGSLIEGTIYGGSVLIVGDGDKHISSSEHTLAIRGGEVDASGQDGALTIGGKIVAAGGVFTPRQGMEITA